MAHGNNFRGGWLPGWVERLYDPFTHSITVIQEPHRMAHDGMMFSVTGKALGLADAASYEFLIQTSTAYLHLSKMRVSLGAGDVDIRAYEGATFSSAGTPLVIQNTNRNSSNTSPSSWSYTPTLTADGVLIHRIWAVPQGTGIGQTPQGLANIEAGEEWILSPNTSYMFRITNNSGGPITLSYDFLWYEATYIDNDGAAQ